MYFMHIYFESRSPTNLFSRRVVDIYDFLTNSNTYKKATIVQ